jgi:lactate permease
MNLPWHQQYDPFQSPFLSTLVAAVPVVVLLASIAILRIRIHFSALLGLGFALAIALWAYHMPGTLAGASAIYGALFGLFPIG